MIYTEEIKHILSTMKNAEAAGALGTSTHMIGYYRKKTGIRSPHSQALAARQYTLNHEFFENIDSETKAYILGFLAADGNVNPDKYGCEVRIVVHPQDTDILEKINSAWDSTYSVKQIHLSDRTGFPGSSKIQSKLSVRSSQFQTSLSKYHIVPNKTLIVRFPDISKNLHRHYLRGLLEGDGYINHEAFGWTGNHQMMNDIQGICLHHGFSELRKYQIKPLSSTVRGTPVHLPIIQWMYKDATICLNRKLQQYNIHWENRIYRRPCRPSYPSSKHIPCALEALPPGLGSLP